MYARLGPVQSLHRRSCAGILLLLAFLGLIVWTIAWYSLQDATASARLNQHVVARIPTYFRTDTLHKLGVSDVRSEADLLPWYFKYGQRRPNPTSVYANATQRLVKVWPEEDPDDRIENQLMFVPESLEGNAQPKLKKIVLYDGFYGWDNVRPGQATFISSRCPVDTCSLTDNKKEASEADVVLFRDKFFHPFGIKRPPNQIWILYTMESPINMKPFKPSGVFNWTATYRRDSDLPIPYGRWLDYAEHGVKPRPRRKVVGLNRTRKVAWVVSNCHSKNGRWEYAAELSKYIDVDIYGKCGNLTCPSTYPDQKCFKTLAKHYKFYLSFENSNCYDYITEKLFHSSFDNHMIPVVMGAPPEHYARVAPPHSYIHVDEFDSPRKLAEYLLLLDRDEALYDTYFRWQSRGEIIGSHLYCRLCALLHDHPDKQARHYKDINAWWRPPGVCMPPGPWRKWRP